MPIQSFSQIIALNHQNQSKIESKIKISIIELHDGKPP
jgi:hypothetical protein